MVRLSDIRLSSLGLAAAAALIMAAGCAKENMIGGEENPISEGGNHAWIERVYASIGEEINSQEPDSKTSINQALDNSGMADMPATKTSIDQTLNPMIRWSAGDEISVFASSVNEEYSFVGEDGAASGSFEHKSGTTGSDTGDSIYAVYPYSESNSISGDTLSVTFPATQTYAANSFGPGAAPMVAVCAASDEPSFNFKPLCGYLKLKLWNAEGKSINKIRLRTNDKTKIAGNAIVVYDGTSGPTVTMADDATSEIDIDCGTNGVALGTSPSTATIFWIVLPPVTMSHGFTISYVNNKGIGFKISSTKSHAISQNTIHSMAVIECNITSDYEPLAVDLGLSVKWAFHNVGTQGLPYDAGSYYAWGDDKTKSSYSWSNYKWMTEGQSDWEYINKYTWPDNQTSANWYDSNGKFVGDSLDVLLPEDDVAHISYGGKWRMPTQSEFSELYSNCTWTWTNFGDVYGYEVKSNMNGYTDNWIFLPAAGNRYFSSLDLGGRGGFYWSSSLYTDYSNFAHILYFDSSKVSLSTGLVRFYGGSVRPVTE